ncbi:MAG TPA: CRISPR-associated endonuclease Cas2 [Syntrophorhabdaceae bacterium]|nr:CRISPR-associated endonuclease Cas2 [Syntrophorhabdaceae bacterium]
MNRTLYLIAYDVCEGKRLGRVRHLLKGYSAASHTSLPIGRFFQHRRASQKGQEGLRKILSIPFFPFPIPLLLYNVNVR